MKNKEKLWEIVKKEMGINMKDRETSDGRCLSIVCPNNSCRIYSLDFTKDCTKIWFWDDEYKEKKENE